MRTSLPSHAQLRYRRPSLDGFEFADVPAQPRSVVSATHAELQAFQEQELFAVVNRILEEYHTAPPSSLDPNRVSSMQGERLPPYNRTRPPFRVNNTFYVAGGRRHSRHNHHSTGVDSEYMFNMRTMQFNAANDCAGATDDQIDLLPTFTLEKGETRPLREIFASMQRAGDVDAKIALIQPGAESDDETGGQMTSYTECAICLCDFEAGDEVTVLPCGHFFHLNGCVREWLSRHARTCPTCRADICSPSSSSDGVASHSATVATSSDILVDQRV